MKHTCCWLLSEPCTFPAKYCGKATGYIIVRDDDNNRVRKYRHLCDEHTDEAAKLPPEDDEAG